MLAQSPPGTRKRPGTSQILRSNSVLVIKTAKIWNRLNNDRFFFSYESVNVQIEKSGLLHTNQHMECLLYAKTQITCFLDIKNI